MPYADPPELYMPEITGPGSSAFKAAVLKLMIEIAESSTVNYSPDR